MSIRKTLLIAFLLVSVLPALLLTSLTYGAAGHAMRKEISQSLMAQSATVSQDIDKMLFERLQNALTWRRLEVMQEIQVNDVDKRLAHFLAELKTGYRDVYLELTCINTAGRVVASSNAANIGASPPAGMPMLQAGEFVVLDKLQPGHGSEPASLTLRARLTSEFNHAAVGELALRFNWDQIYQMLDQAAQGGRMVLLLDPDHQIIAASRALRDQGLLLTKLPAEWQMRQHKNGIKILDGSPLHLGEVSVGYDHSRGFQHFAGFGWTTLVIQPTSQAFIPVTKIALLFLAFFLLCSIISVGLSILVAGRIARPITALTAFTRRFKQQKLLPPAPKASGGEVGELTDAFVQTVHDLDQSRADLIRASKLAVLGELAAVMAHEIRTPVGILRSSAQMLAREPGLTAEARELTGFIESETERLNRLVTMLLDSARPRAPNLQPTDLDPLIKQSIALLAAQAEKKQVQVRAALANPSAMIEADAEQMTQVLLNLLLNAIQIVAPGGQVEISTRQEPQHLRVDIADDGPGIAPQDRPRVFDPFFTKREGGVGLGLAVVQQIIEAHGGHIQADKSHLGGALFTITLPRKESP